MDTSNTKWRGMGIAVLRWVVGLVFLLHGGQKLFVFHFAGTTAFFTKAGIPLPGISAVVVTLVEFLGGLALILGLGTRWAGLLLAIDMLGAIVFVHGTHGFFLNTGGYEYALTMLAANITFVLSGAGACAIDNLIGRRKQPELRAKAA
jgi:putative oxidoreductase